MSWLGHSGKQPPGGLLEGEEGPSSEKLREAFRNRDKVQIRERGEAEGHRVGKASPTEEAEHKIGSATLGNGTPAKPGGTTGENRAQGQGWEEPLTQQKC